MLEERFASPKLDSFSQRLSARCYLEAFNRTETQDYIQWQIDSAGGLGSEVFPEATCQTVFQATGGVPRLVNQVCDHALLLAYVAGRKTIEPANVEEAWADLQQLPTPWSGGAKSDAADSGVIEFGSLDDSPETTDRAASGSATSARVFRVASVEEEEAEAGDFEPSEQIHRIEELLAKADDDFQPAGSIGPEIELHFEETPHPFQEEFEHEEVVSDRYAPKAATEVRCTESRDSSPRSGAVAATCHTVQRGRVQNAAFPSVYRVSRRCRKNPWTMRNRFQISLHRRRHPPIAPTQRREYRHLFAQLLRG